MKLQSRLFLKVYLAVLGSIVALALAGMLAVVLISAARDEQPEWLEQRAALIAETLPQNGTAGELQAALERIGPLARAELAVTDADGRVIAAFQPRHGKERANRRDAVTVSLGAGRTLAARFESPFPVRRGNPLFLLVAAAVATALVAWPVVRHLTRRLERLRQGVEAWGKGDLALRVPVEGGDEIAAVAASFNRAAARVEQMIESNRALLANASHELRSPLARLRMGLDLYEAAPSRERQEEIQRNLAELDELVGEILLSSRLDHAPVADGFVPLDLLALAAEEASFAGLEVAGESAEVNGDARLLARLIRNLIQNALRHGRPPVEIAVKRRGAMAELSVRDHGDGIAGADSGRIFDPFYRPGGYGEAAGGWGLGLSLVRQITERHGGAVRHETPPGGGTAFIVTLPLLRHPAAVD